MKIYGVQYYSLSESYGCTYFSSKQEAQKYIDVISYGLHKYESYELKELDVEDKYVIKMPKYIYVSANIYDGILGEPEVIWGDTQIHTEITNDSIVFSVSTKGILSEKLMDKIVETAEELLKERVN